jgi:hemoglobin/transferrin/lactoferrin receptor protein
MIYDGEMMRIQMNKNIEHATIYGVNINASYKLNNSITFKASYNYLNGLTMERGPLSHIPPINGKFSINYKYKKNQLVFFTKYNAEKKAADYDAEGVDNLNEATIDGNPAWYTLNLSYSSKIDKNLSFSIAIENITDIHYKTFGSGLSASGRNIILSLSTNF